jgi:hypothetical protein
MIVLALRTVAPDLHVTVPATADRTVQRLLERQRVELPLVDGVSSRLLAQASQKHFLTEFYAQLLASNHGTCSVHEAPLPESWAGLDFASLQRLFVEQEHADLTLVGVRHADSDGQMSLLVNPRRGSDRSTPLLAGDRLLVLARSHPDLDAISRDAPRPRAV